MPEIEIDLFGFGPSFRPGDGPVMARVAIDGEPGDVLIDPERGRCRVEAFGGRDLDRWTSAGGILMAARSGWWGFRVIEDHLPDPTPQDDPPGPAVPGRKRPHLPRDLASCPWCGSVVVLARDRSGAGFGLVTPSVRLFRRIKALYRSSGELFPIAGRGKGRRGGRPHSVDCCPLPVFRPFPEPAPKKRGRGRPRLDPTPRVPLPYEIRRKPRPHRPT